MNNLWFNMSKTKGIWTGIGPLSSCVPNEDGMTILVDDRMTYQWQRGILSTEDVNAIMIKRYKSVINVMIAEIEEEKA